MNAEAGGPEMLCSFPPSCQLSHARFLLFVFFSCVQTRLYSFAAFGCPLASKTLVTKQCLWTALVVQHLAAADGDIGESIQPHNDWGKGGDVLGTVAAHR